MTHSEQGASTQELLPCPNPWCVPSETLRPTLVWYDQEAVVECGSCGMQGPYVSPVVMNDDGEQVGTRDAEAEAITAWNTRIEHTPSDRNAVLEEAARHLEDQDGHGEWRDAAAAIRALTTTPEPTEPARVAGQVPLALWDGEKHRNGVWVPQEVFYRLAALSRTPSLLEVAKEALEYTLKSLGDPVPISRRHVARKILAALQAIKGAEQ